MSPEALQDAFLKYFDHSAPVQWFNGQMKPAFGIDVFESPFPYERASRFLREAGLAC